MRISIDFPVRLAAVLQETADEEQVSRAELLRKAILTYAILRKEVERGNKIALLKDGEVEKEIIFSI